MLPYFKVRFLHAGDEQMLASMVGCWLSLQSETFTPPAQNIQDDYPGVISDDLSPHGTDGPVGSSVSNYQYPVIRK